MVRLVLAGGLRGSAANRRQDAGRHTRKSSAHPLLAGPAAPLTRLHPARSTDGGGELVAATNRPCRKDCIWKVRSALCRPWL